MNLRLYIINGGHVLFVCTLLCFLDPLFSLYIYLKIQPTLYYHTFSHLYPIPYYKWKHMVRVTDTGFIANMMYYFYPYMLPLVFNIHFIITFGFWFAVLFLDMKDLDMVEHDDIIPIFHNVHAILNHSVSFIILFYQNMKNSYAFNGESLTLSYLWLYSWLVFVYIPWRALTGDIVYSFFDTKRTTIKPLLMYVIVHILLYISNELGKNTSGFLQV